MRKFLAGVAAAVLAFAAQPGAYGAQVSFTSAPAGAKVLVDGELIGSTVQSLWTDLSAGPAHHVQFALDGYETVDEYLVLTEGSHIVKHADMVPLKGLLLVTTEPEGAEISLDGYSLGETPRLITSLNAKDTHNLVLRKTGYQDRKLEVRFDGRNPLVRNVNLVLDSGVINITSEPAGVEVTLNGISRGTTPVTVSGIPKGRASVTLRREGYIEELREIAVNAGDVQDLFVTMRAQPGTLKLTSVPEGARFYIDDEAQGRGPVFAKGLAPKTYSVRAEMDGYGTVERMISVGRGETVAEEFKLVSILGSLEIRTMPAEASVYVDGKFCGVTKSGGGDGKTEASETLIIPNLKDGEHTLVVKCQGHAEIVRHPVVEASKATQVNIKLKRVFTPDIRLVTATGTIEGVLVSSDPLSYVVEVSLGITRSISRDTVRSVEPILQEK